MDVIPRTKHNSGESEASEGLMGCAKWQTMTRNVQQRFNYIFYSKEFYDLTIVFPEAEFKIHKLVLSIHSPFFEKMFFGSLPYEEPTLELQGISCDAFIWLLEYMYLGIITLRETDLALEIYSFAHEKQMDLLVARCSKFLAGNVTVDNALMMLHMASLYDDEELKAEAGKRMFEKRECIFNSEDICSMPKPVLLDLISKGKLYCSEKVVFRSIYNWSKMQIQNREEEVTPQEIRKEINDFLPHIHFLLMSPNSFITEVVSTSIFTAKESLSILRKMNHVDVEESVPEFLSNMMLSSYHSKDVSKHMITLGLIKYPNCDSSFILNHTRIQYKDILTMLKVSENILLSSVKTRPHCFSGTWKIIVMDNDKEIGVSTNDFSPWHFEPLIPLLADKSYIFRIEGKGRRSKHDIIEFGTKMNGVCFTGTSFGCQINIVYFTK